MTRSRRWFSLPRCPRDPRARRPAPAGRRRWSRSSGGTRWTGRSTDWIKDLAEGFNKSQHGVPGQGRLQGHLPRDHDGRDRRVPCQAAAAHRPGVRGRDGDHDGRQGRHQARLRADGGAGEKFDPKAYLPRGHAATTRPPMAGCSRSRSTARRRSSTTTRMPSRRPGSIRTSRPRPGPRWASTAKKIQAAGYPCGFSTPVAAWILLENYSAWHNVPFATKENGFAGLDTELRFNTPLHVRLIDQLAAVAEDQDLRLRRAQGRREPEVRDGGVRHVPGLVGALRERRSRRKAKFEFGIGMMPYWPDVAGAPQNSIIGGATLWVLAGHKPAEYKGVAKFFTYLSSPEVQAAFAPADRLPADHAGGVRADQEAGVLREEPGAPTPRSGR